MTLTLDIVNHMLNVIGETPVTNVNSSHPSVLSARVELDRVNKEFQAKGWWFNTEYNLKLSPNESGQVIIPSNTLFIDPTSIGSRLTQRGNKLYDPVNHTFVLDTDVYVDLIMLLSVDDLPVTAGFWVMHKAAYDFYVNDDGDETKSERLLYQANLAWANMQAEELKISGVNALNRPASLRLKAGMLQQAGRKNPNLIGG